MPPRPKPRIRQFQDQHGLTDDGLAALLAERLDDDTIDVEAMRKVMNRGDRKLPKDWQAALELPDLPRFRAGDKDAPEPLETSPREKAKVAEPVPDELDWRNVKEALVSIYVVVGKGVAMIRKNPQVEQAFVQGAPILADDWIRLARVDARTRGVLAKLVVAGPGGQLAMDHMILVMKLLTLEKPQIAGQISQVMPTAADVTPLLRDEPSESAAPAA